MLDNHNVWLEFLPNLCVLDRQDEQDQMHLTFQAFRENRLPLTVRLRDPTQPSAGRAVFSRDSRAQLALLQHLPAQTTQPIAIINMQLPGSGQEEPSAEVPPGISCFELPSMRYTLNVFNCAVIMHFRSPRSRLTSFQKCSTHAIY